MNQNSGAIHRRIIILALAVLMCAPVGAQTAIPPAPSSTTAVERAVATYFTKDSVGDVQLGRLGLEKGRSAAVKRVAQMMVSDHTTTAHQGRRLAERLGANDASLEPSEESVITRAKLARESAESFDKAWTHEVIEAHESDIQLARSSLAVTQDPELKRYEQSTLAVDRKHLENAQRAMRALEGVALR